MGCSNCSTGKDGTPKGCKSNGHCATGGCNKLNTFDWLADINPPVDQRCDIVEISFKKGASKSFYRLPDELPVVTGDMVAVESTAGYDVGRISLMGELVRLQMRKKRVRSNATIPAVLRIANERDLERLAEARAAEQETMVRARAIARSLGLDMKIGDVEFQGDKRKATFFYTADGRVDFRELIRVYAREFRVKIEMRQIGARQESARIGGIGSCGRELCCSTWLSDFKSVSTTAARYQNLAINQAKLSGQCGRLKCCLNYELDTYLEALEGFPRQANVLRTEAGDAVLLKTDIFKRLMFYSYRNKRMSPTYTLTVDRVREIIRLNKKGKKPVELMNDALLAASEAEKNQDEFVDGTGDIELKPLEKKHKRRSRRRSNKKSNAPKSKQQPKEKGKGKEQGKGASPQNKRKSNKRRRSNKNKRNNRGGKPNKGKDDKS